MLGQHVGPRQIPDDSGCTIPHVLDARQFDRDWLETVLYPLAAKLQRMAPSEYPQSLVGKRLFYLFYESSTRTRVSFETAMTLLGGTVAGMEVHHDRADAERLEDRIQVLNQYPYDFLLLRYHEEGGASRAAVVSRMPVINAGDGMGQHPTQALLDTYTLWREFGHIDGLRIALVGDLSYERSTHSIAYLLSQFRRVQLYLVSPRLLRMNDEVRAYLDGSGVKVIESQDLRMVVDEVDVIYMTKALSARLEHATRFDNGSSCYSLDAEVLARLQPHARVLHPLPRGRELPVEFDSDRRIACFRQAGNGLFVRMALLCLLVQDELPSVVGTRFP